MATPYPDFAANYKQMVKDSQEKEKNDKKEQKEKYIKAFDSYYKKQILSIISDTKYMHTRLTKIAKSGQTEWKNFMYVSTCNGMGFFGRLRGLWRWNFSEDRRRVLSSCLIGWSELLQNTISKDIYFEMREYSPNIFAIHIKIIQ